jgi:hypothetical protein
MYQNTMWNQSDVSSAMDYLHHIGELKYTDNGVHRVYSAVNRPVPTHKVTLTAVPTNSQVPTKAKSTKRPLTTKSIGKHEAIKLMMDTNGKFFGVTFIKKDNTVRNMTCRIDKNYTGPDALGYLRVIDADEQVSKKLNLQTVSEVRTNRIIHKVK